jgi:hypothetical protein
MITLSYFRKGLKRRECWFCDGKHVSRFTRFFQASSSPKSSFRNSEKETWIIQLSDWSFSSIHKKTRYDIRRIQEEDANKKIIKWAELSKVDKLGIVTSYNDFARDKGVTLLNEERLNAAEKSVFYSCIQLESSFSYHLYIHDEKRVRLLYSWTLFDQPSSAILAGLNKLHTAVDIEYAKESNFVMFDFGGYKASRMNGIDKFKSRFGGTSVVEYNYVQLI